jgi:hypothetical protein
VNGPAHFREAERLLAWKTPTSDVLARAQVHATLALAAATVEDIRSDQLRDGWLDIVSEDEPIYRPVPDPEESP